METNDGWTRPIALLYRLTHTHTRLTDFFPGLPGWILLKQETVSGSGISWTICKSASRSRQPCQHPTTQSYLQAGCPSCRPTNSVKALKALIVPTNEVGKCWRHDSTRLVLCSKVARDSRNRWAKTVEPLARGQCSRGVARRRS